MARIGSALPLMAPAAVGVIAGLGAIALGLGVVEAVAVGAVVMALGNLVRRSLIASPAGGSDR